MNSPEALNCFENELLGATKDLFVSNQRSSTRNFSRWRCQTKTTLAVAMSHLDESLAIQAYLDVARLLAPQ